MRADERARRLFTESFGTEPSLLVRAPGRVNLIGDHTDYNGGFVLPMAIDQDLIVAAAPRADRTISVASESEEGRAEFSLDSIEHGRGWAEYLKGVAVALGAESLRGWDGVIASDLAVGAGLSSSAAIELAAARVFAEVSGLVWDPTAMALVGQQAENNWVGMNSGVMDQLICATGRTGHARLIDCRDLSGLDVPLIAGSSVILLDTGTRRSLVDSEYNERRASCEEAARLLGVDQLRDVAAHELTPDALPPSLYIRARHVVTENERTTHAADTLAAGDAATVGRLMNESHVSLRDDFEVSSQPLDAMARAAWAAPGCHGARQTGGGFAGSCVALVETPSVPAFISQVMAEVGVGAGKAATTTVVTASEGVEAQWME